eukprot:593631-Prorocentrum_minimum.AAC.1
MTPLKASSSATMSMASQKGLSSTCGAGQFTSGGGQFTMQKGLSSTLAMVGGEKVVIRGFIDQV